MRPHQFQILDGGAPAAVAGRGFHPVGSQLATDFAEADLVLVFQVAVLKDDLNLLAAVVGEVNDRLEFLAHVIPVSAEDLADVYDCVQFLAAVVESLLCLREFDCRRLAAMREAYGGACPDRAAAQNLRTAFQVIRHDADAGAVVIHPLLASLLESLVRQAGIQQRVVNHLGNIFVGVIHRILLMMMRDSPVDENGKQTESPATWNPEERRSYHHFQGGFSGSNFSNSSISQAS